MTVQLSFFDIYDSRDGKSVSVAKCRSKNSALETIESWRERDCKGGRVKL